MEKATLSQFQASTFLISIFEEENEKQRNKERQQRQCRTYSLRKDEYTTKTRKLNENHWKQHQLNPIGGAGNAKGLKEAEGLKDTKGLKGEPNSKVKSESLSQFGIMKLGNDYMKEIHSSIGHAIPSKLQAEPTSLPAVPKHEAYLKQMRTQRK